MAHSRPTRTDLDDDMPLGGEDWDNGEPLPPPQAPTPPTADQLTLAFRADVLNALAAIMSAQNHMARDIAELKGIVRTMQVMGGQGGALRSSRQPHPDPGGSKRGFGVDK